MERKGKRNMKRFKRKFRCHQHENTNLQMQKVVTEKAQGERVRIWKNYCRED